MREAHSHGFPRENNHACMFSFYRAKQKGFTNLRFVAQSETIEKTLYSKVCTFL